MFSIIVPLDDNRLEQFKNTKRVYDIMPQEKEFIIPTRSETEVRNYLKKYELDKDVKLIPYTLEIGFNCSRALNMGVRNSRYSSIIITSPEVRPTTPVLEQLEKLVGTNVICQVWDENEKNVIFRPLVNSQFRNETPAFYYLAMFNKADIEKINGWDEDFLQGYAYEDRDFGERWNRAKIPFIVRDDIQARHQYHPRVETIQGGTRINHRKFNKNTASGITKCVNGLEKL